MVNTTQIKVIEALKGDWVPETKECWIDLKVDEENTLRLTFPDNFPSALKLALQKLQGHVSEQRRKVGLPVIESTYTVAIKHLEFFHDDINQVAGIRTHFQNGASQDTVFEKAHLRPTIEHLTSALVRFENQSRSQKH